MPRSTASLANAARVFLAAFFITACSGEPTRPDAVPTTGSLVLVATGLPQGVNGSFFITGANGFSRQVNAEFTLGELAPGSYRVRAFDVVSSVGTHSPEQREQDVTVVAATTTSAGVTYSLLRPANQDVTRIVDSVRVAYNLPALGGAIVTRANHSFARGVAGSRRIGGPAVTINDLWHLGSNFKAFTGMLAAVAVGRGVIDWTTTVSQAFPELAATTRSEYTGVTLRELLAHSSGVPRDPASTAITGSTRQQNRNAVAAWALSQAPVTTRGTYNYTNTGYMLAAAMVERALGTTFEAAMGNAVFNPLGISDGGYGPQATTGSNAQPVAHVWRDGAWSAVEAFDNPPVYASPGGVHMSIDSWSRFLQEVLRLESGAPTIVPLSAGQETTRSITSTIGADSYGLGWGITSRTWANGKTLTHSGTNGANYSVTWMAPQRSFAVLVVTNAYDLSSPERSALAADALAGRLISFYLNGR